ncbi:hypothetical protein KOR34_29850 [Posidoniimonas corsicana]|uniref:Uncharacterized protein n=1 Tax=Posidoniimonas corsicana TaxID=1938618 RepID=A0A5C5VHD5_9BACT|nr:hypothetical protein [Posidoniimonas corsicana]TWT38018.1 hypothetical protein KOR34_29850 [Posidoniimonas corsicana]
MSTREERDRQILRRRNATRRARGRRGVLLLIVLSILVMFMLVGTAFVLTGSRVSDAARAGAKANVAAPQQADLLDRALRQVLRDTNDRNSAIRYHSLLRDAYGTDGFVANVFAGVTPYNATRLDQGFNGLNVQYVSRFSEDTAGNGGPTLGQLIDIYVRDDINGTPADTQAAAQTQALTPDFVVGLEPSADGVPVDHTLSRIDGYYNGCLLTMLSGPAKGQSTRIIDYKRLDLETPNDPSDDVYRLRVMAFPRADGGLLRLPAGVPAVNGAQHDLIDATSTGLVGHTFMVNGRPFNGSGVGLDLLSNPAAARLTTMERLQLVSGQHVGMETALAPHSRYFTPALASHFALNQGGRRAGVASAPLTNEDPFFGHNQNSFTALNSLYQHFVGPGDADESYDAPDFQNMFLASNPQRPRWRGRVVTLNSTVGPIECDRFFRESRRGVIERLDLEGLPIPSYHRPALVNYWLHKLWNSPWLMAAVSDNNLRVKAILQPYGPDLLPGTGDEWGSITTNVAAQIVAFKRKYILRPLPEDHPGFTGGNVFATYTASNVDLNSTNSMVYGDSITFPSFEVAGPWDVDNNGDGIPDSIWVDLGMPVQRTEDGRLYRPLFAILVQDLDGRLNLNAHGSTDHMASETLDNSRNRDNGRRLQRTPTGRAGGNLAGDATPDPNGVVSAILSSDILPHGSGWGPGDITLRPVLSPELPRSYPGRVGNYGYDDLARLFAGRPGLNTGASSAATSSPVVWGRYGSQASVLMNNQMTVAPGTPYNPALTPATLDVLAALEKHDYPEYTPAHPRATRSGFASMPDLRSKFAVGIDYTGQPIFEPQYEVYAGGSTQLKTDSPYELDLMNHSRRDHVADLLDVTNAYGGVGTIDDDAPFSPGELERILRSFDADAARLPDRLWNLVDAFDPQKLTVQGYQLTAANPDATSGVQPSPAQLLQAQIEAATNSRSVTTESFDIPSTNEDWTARLVAGADGLPGIPTNDSDLPYVDPTVDRQAAWDADVDDYAVVMGEPVPAGARLVDYLRYRIVLELKRQGVVNVLALASDPEVAEAVSRIIDGGARTTDEILSMRLGGVQNYERRASFGGLLAPEVMAGLKMDLNRPFGDGRDNNNNGVVDEPLEAGEPWIADDNGNFSRHLEQNGANAFQGSMDRLPHQSLDPTLSYPFDYTFGKDANGRGATLPGGEVIHDDANMARQLYARHLYCMALLLMEEQYLAPFDKRDAQVLEYLDPDAGLNANSQREPSMAWKIAQSLAGDAELDGTPTASAAQKQEGRRLAWRKLTCRRIAQWAINCADMRDADAVCTPFEYDENPWDGWNVVGSVGRRGGTTNPQIHPIDGDPSTNENLGQYRVVSAGGWGNQSGNSALAHNATRGLVWGMERPELLLTETFATHDRRTEDLEGFTPNDGPNPGQENELIAPTGGNANPNTNPDPNMDQRLRPLGTLFVEVYNPNSPDSPQPAELSRTVTMNTATGQTGIALDRMSDAADADGKFSPVWRMIVVEEDPRLRNDQLTFDNGSYGDYEAFGNIPSLNGLASAVAQGEVRPLASDPDFPSFDPLKVPSYRADANGSLRADKQKQGAYIDRAIYFSAGNNEDRPAEERDPEDLRVRIPLRWYDVPLTGRMLPRRNAGLPAGTLRNNVNEWLLWPEGNKIVTENGQTVLRVFDHHFPPADIDGDGDYDDYEPFAPILPGRYAVIGTAGYQYNARWNPPTKQQEFPGRYITPFGRAFASTQNTGAVQNQSPGQRRDEMHHDSLLRLTRRFDMMPHPNPEIHQFAVLNNGGPESRMIDANGDGTFDRNLTNPPIDDGSDPTTLAETVGDLGFDPTPLNRTPLSPNNANRQIQPVVSIPIEGLAVSTPLDGYLLKMLNLDNEAPARWWPNAAYGEGALVGNVQVGPLDTPLDDPDTEPHLTQSVTTPNFRSVHLQRLADPTLPWNPVDTNHAQHDTDLPVNPYVTVDTESVDLTAFNGVDPAADPDDPNNPATLRSGVPQAQGGARTGLVFMNMASLQRGGYEAAVADPTAIPAAADPSAVAVPPARSPWSREPTHISKDIAVGNQGVSSLAEAPGQFAYQWYDPVGQTPQRSNGFAGFMNLTTELEPERPMVFNSPIRHSLGYANSFYPAVNGARNIAEPHTPFYTSNAFIDSDNDGSPDLDTSAYHEVDTNADGVPGDLIGAPMTRPHSGSGPQDDHTYPWVTWNNRPFASALELLQVPATTAAGLGNEFSVFSADRSVVPNDYNGAVVDLSDDAANNDARQAFQHGSFGHLLNMLSTSSIPALAYSDDGNNGVALRPQGAPNLHRLTSYVRVPSRFVASQTTLNPEGFNLTSTLGAPLDPRAGLLAPFNRVDQYREPGRVNLNTITGVRPDPLSPLVTWSPTYDGMMHRYRDGNLVDTGGVLQRLGHRGPAWRDVVLSRRGYVDTAFSSERQDTSEMSLNPLVPTFFGNPFREPDEGQLVPIADLVHAGAEASVLRSHPFSPITAAGSADAHWGVIKQDDNNDGVTDDAGEAGLAGDTALFDTNTGLAQGYALEPDQYQGAARVPLFSAGVTEAGLNGQRNSALRYMPLTRVSSMATTRSGVFAIWVTVGFFEVTPAAPWTLPDGSANVPVQARFNNNRDLYDRVYPDGYQLGKEMGSDTGDTRRHRGFWIVDRTLPVAFRPGEDVNLEKMILLRREIE